MSAAALAVAGTLQEPPIAFGRRLTRRRPPLCPEIELWLLDDALDLEQTCRDLAECHPPPYWAFCWASGQALARFVLDQPWRVAGRHVVDFGAGCGVAAIAALRAGARSVTAVDIDPAARQACARNAALNGLALGCAEQAPERIDVLLAADVLYEPTNAAWLDARRRGGTRALVADPERAASPDLGRTPSRRYRARTLPDVDPPQRHAAVFVL